MAHITHLIYFFTGTGAPQQAHRTVTNQQQPTRAPAGVLISIRASLRRRLRCSHTQRDLQHIITHHYSSLRNSLLIITHHYSNSIAHHFSSLLIITQFVTHHYSSLLIFTQFITHHYSNSITHHYAPLHYLGWVKNLLRCLKIACHKTFHTQPLRMKIEGGVDPPPRFLCVMMSKKEIYE